MAPAPAELEAEARRGAEAAREKGRNTTKEGKGDTRPELARLTVEAIQILDGLARFELVFRERAGKWEEGVDPKTRTRTERGGGEEGEGGEGGVGRVIGSG